MTDAQALTVRTRPTAGLRSLVFLADPRHPLLWMRGGDGIAGYGEAMRLEFSGPDRLTDAAAAWRDVVARAQIDDDVRLPGSGLVAFGTFAFADESSATSVLIVPELIVGRRGSKAWVTRIGDGAGIDPVMRAFGDDFRVTLRAGQTSPADYVDAVSTAVGRINDDELGKVVLARDLIGRLPAGSDVRRIAAELAIGYPACWTFCVDGMVGASPETLVRSEKGTVSARVLAGTLPRGRDDRADAEAADSLARSPKNTAEHAFAVRSVLDTLGRHTIRLQKSQPFTLRLPNLWHLATDVEGVLHDGSTSLDLVADMHPTAAVAGTPTDAALAVIRSLEKFDRGRYAGPVGWIDAHGDGEWAIALRCAQVDEDDVVHAYAGCGIVGDSDPAAELAESRIKFRPIVEALA